MTETRETWTWVQPANQAELLARLAKARDLAVPERERENLCACAYTEIVRLQRLFKSACLLVDPNDL